MKNICKTHEETTRNLNINYFFTASFWKYLYFMYIYFAYLNPIQYEGVQEGLPTSFPL